jgi:dolichyl-phosphate beta-glucosyltransferase
MNSVYLSIVIPAYNEEDRLLDSLEKVVTYLEQHHWQSEVIVVDDGSIDQTCAVVQAFAAAPT